MVWILYFVYSEYEKIQKIVDDLKNQYTNLERQDVACRENIKNSKEKLKKLAKNLETEEAKVIMFYLSFRLIWKLLILVFAKFLKNYAMIGFQNKYK